METEELKVWQTQSIKHKVALVLIIDGVSFSYNENDGIVFSATESYVDNLKKRIVSCYQSSLEPIVNEYKKNDGSVL